MQDAGDAGLVTVSEFTFLALGLVLGVAAGAALSVVLRARPPAAREVRVTVAQDAVPRRGGSTLSDDAFARAAAEPARGGPADRREVDAAPPPGDTDRRTPVRSGWPAAGPAPVGVPISQGDDPMLASLRVRATAETTATRPRASTAIMDAPADRTAGRDQGPGVTSGSGATSQGPDGGASVTDSSGTASPSVAGQTIDDSGPCAEQRRISDERCELAVRARARAATAEDTLRSAQRAYDDHEARAEEAGHAADPRAVRAAKDAAQAAFRSGRNAARTTAEVEAAASAWLSEVNRINADARDAAAVATREREAATVLALELERLGMESDAARIGAETADAACLAAREAVADCQERASDEAAASDPPVAPGGPFTDEAVPMGVLGAASTPRIFRLLRGDRAAMGELVAALAGEQPDDRRRWQLALSDLVDAIVADSIAASALEFPTDHPFWGPFTVAQSRDVTSALSSLGYRFDGLGGWVDGRFPSQRDLSLAVGYAGLDPMRIRQWPTEATMVELFRDVAVAADEHLASAAGDLTLGELVTMLGRRADGLAEVWNEWGRLRPLLLEER
ncbi:MAG: hypothetical protein ACSLFN_10090 [Candidatus Limnocylindrales bacterium]